MYRERERERERARGPGGGVSRRVWNVNELNTFPIETSYFLRG